ncbi:hypothetical protein BDF19DRAFT_231756 [Syncephalis fuscata]|nr:hypothetical protein BDF19DRAFT_231756 [Syncephalis fuscata]
MVQAVIRLILDYCRYLVVSFYQFCLCCYSPLMCVPGHGIMLITSLFLKLIHVIICIFINFLNFPVYSLLYLLIV